MSLPVTATNFQDPPHSTWGFHHVRELHPTAQVWRGPRPTNPFPESPCDLTSLEVVEGDGNTGVAADILDDDHTDGFLVLHEGNIVCERYGNGMRAQDTHILMSTTKSFTGSLAGILEKQGQLDVTALVTDCLPELRGTGYDGATVRHLLDMRVGLDFSEDYENPLSEFAFLDAACGWRPLPTEAAPDNLGAFMQTIRGKGVHGGPFHYVSASSIVLGWILEAVTGSRFAELLSTHIWQPMGAEFDADLVLDRHGRSQTEGGLNVTLRDLARFGELHRNQGKLNGQQIIPADWIDDLQHNGDADAWDRGVLGEAMPGHHYRSQWYTHVAHPHRPYFTLGAFGQTVYVDPVARTVIAQLSSHPKSVDEKRFDRMFRLFRAVCDWGNQ